MTTWNNGVKNSTEHQEEPRNLANESYLILDTSAYLLLDTGGLLVLEDNLGKIGIEDIPLTIELMKKGVIIPATFLPGFVQGE